MTRGVKSRLWKLSINDATGLETVESAVAEACKKIIQRADPEGPLCLLERVDMREGETTVYITGNERTATELLRVLGTRMAQAKISISTPSRKRIENG